MFFQAKLSYLRKHPLILLHAGCLITFTVQMIVLAMNQISPSTTISHLEERSLDSIDFPVLFKICIKPAFHTSELYKAGYENIWHYFMGQSRYNKSVFGWGGHTDNGSIIGTAGGKGVELRKQTFPSLLKPQLNLKPNHTLVRFDKNIKLFAVLLT